MRELRASMTFTDYTCVLWKLWISFARSNLIGPKYWFIFYNHRSAYSHGWRTHAQTNKGNRSKEKHVFIGCVRLPEWRLLLSIYGRTESPVSGTAVKRSLYVLLHRKAFRNRLWTCWFLSNITRAIFFLLNYERERRERKKEGRERESLVRRLL